MRFEYDENKSKINKSKHNISFEEAKELWEDPYSFEIPSTQSEDEDRFILLGLSCKLKILTVVHCYMDNENNIRIISARKSTKKEQKQYKEYLS